METDIFYKHWKTFLTECIFLQFSICKKAENVKKLRIGAGMGINSKEVFYKFHISAIFSKMNMI